MRAPAELGPDAVLEEVEDVPALSTQALADGEGHAPEDYVVVIDSGDVVAIDAGAVAKKLEPDRLEDEIERAHREDRQSEGLVTLLGDSKGIACGLTFHPPFGDGEYPVLVRRRGQVLEIRIRVGGDL